MVRRYAIAANAVHVTNMCACVLESKKEIPSMQAAMTSPQPRNLAGVTLSSFTTHAAPADGRATLGAALAVLEAAFDPLPENIAPSLVRSVPKPSGR